MGAIYEPWRLPNAPARPMYVWLPSLFEKTTQRRRRRLWEDLWKWLSFSSFHTELMLLYTLIPSVSSFNWPILLVREKQDISCISKEVTELKEKKKWKQSEKSYISMNDFIFFSPPIRFKTVEANTKQRGGCCDNVSNADYHRISLSERFLNLLK